MNTNRKMIIGAVILGVIVLILLVVAMAQPSAKPELPEYTPPIISPENDSDIYNRDNYDQPYNNVPEVTPPSDLPEDEMERERPMDPYISRERAREIAYEYLEDRGISATFREDMGLTWERGKWAWQLEFRSGEIIYEFFIDVETGEIMRSRTDGER